MAKNEFKKKDSKGERLPDMIKEFSVNSIHLAKVMDAQKMDKVCTYKDSVIGDLRFTKACERAGLKPSFVRRELSRMFEECVSSDGNIDINKFKNNL